ncbi:MAG: hypothetical protein ACP5HG_08000 [Anaerolineae bacterium]
MTVTGAILLAAAAVALLWLPHILSYGILKRHILNRQRWGLNICSGATDGGGVNADIVHHRRLPKFVQVDVYRLPAARWLQNILGQRIRA